MTSPAGRCPEVTYAARAGRNRSRIGAGGLRGRGAEAASLPCPVHRFLLTSAKPSGHKFLDPRHADQLHPLIPLSSELSPSVPGLDFTLQGKPQRSARRPHDIPGATARGARPLRPGERARGLRGDAPPRTSPLARVGRPPPRARFHSRTRG